MKKNAVLIGLLGWIFSLPMQAQNPAQARCDAFGKGQNLSNWLEAYWDPTFPNATRYTKNDLQKMKDAGIQSLRLPVAFSSVIDTLPPYHVDMSSALFSYVDTVVAWCNELDLMLIIDNHHGWTLTNSTWRKQEIRFSHLWSVLAERYKNLDPDRFVFELLNEPGIPTDEVLDNDSLSLLFNMAIDSVRKHTTAHSIIVSTSYGSWGALYAEFTPLADTNLIYTWHTYDPINFTHQGFPWNTPYYAPGIVFPDANNVFEQMVAMGWTAVIDWKNLHHKPIFLGEFGVSRHADAVSRCNWIEFVGAKLIQNNFSWFYWDWGIDFSMFYSDVISEDSIIPCFKSALRLYGDTTFTSIKNIDGNDIFFNVFPTIADRGNSILIETNSSEIYTCEVVGTLGNALIKKEMSGTQNQLDLNFPSGMYFLLLKTKKQNIVKRIIVR